MEINIKEKAVARLLMEAHRLRERESLHRQQADEGIRAAEYCEQREAEYNKAATEIAKAFDASELDMNKVMSVLNSGDMGLELA